MESQASIEKKALRKLYKAKRQELGDELRHQYSVQIKTHLIHSTLIEAKTFHIFLPIARLFELDTLLIIKELHRLEKTVYVPFVQDGIMRTGKLNSDDELIHDEMGIPCPKDIQEVDALSIDVICLPLLICDQNGNRIGYGKGFYDGFLEKYPKSKRIGLNFFEAIPTHFEADDWDIPLHGLISPDGLVYF